MIHPRTAIRAYAWNMLKDAVDVGGRVFLNRPNSVLVDELPAVTIYFDSESVEVSEGDRYVPQQYERTLNLQVDILVEQPVDPTQAARAEDRLDYLARQVERAFAIDNFFQERLTGYEDHNSPGLLAGSRLLSTMPDTIELGSDRTLGRQGLIFALTYIEDAFFSEKVKEIDSYNVKFNRVDWDDETVDPTLIEATGDFE